MKYAPVKPRFKRVLLVDDDMIDNYINERIVTSFGFAGEVVVKTTAFDALAFLVDEQQDPDRLPEFIFLDLNIPVLDGFGFLREFEMVVEKFPVIAERCRIIVLSSSMSPEDIDRASVNRFVTKYLNKPLSEKYLEAINI